MKQITPLIYCWLAAVLALALCDRGNIAVAEASSGWVMAPSDFKVGEHDQNGRLVFWEIHAFDHMEPFVLHEDYGVMLVNQGSEEAPVPLYILATQKTKEVITTHDFEEFEKRLLQIPKGAALGHYGTCSVPRTWGLPDSMIASYGAAIDALRSTHPVEDWIVCYCPNRG